MSFQDVFGGGGSPAPPSQENGKISYSHYGTMVDAGEYFANRLHSRAWDKASADKRRRGLIAASRIIDTLSYIGDKTDESQVHEFPRFGELIVPADIQQACYELSYSLLDGRDPDAELENLGITSQGIVSVRTTYSRDQVPIEHLINGVPNYSAWRLIRPFLRDETSIKLTRS